MFANGLVTRSKPREGVWEVEEIPSTPKNFLVDLSLIEQMAQPFCHWCHSSYGRIRRTAECTLGVSEFL